jgi:hypothetical protein
MKPRSSFMAAVTAVLAAALATASAADASSTSTAVPGQWSASWASAPQRQRAGERVESGPDERR